MTIERLEVAAGVLHRGDTVLLAERVRGGHGDGFWEFPGGKIEPGESPTDALIRELGEELGVRITDASPLLVTEHRYPERHVRLHVFDVHAWRGEPAGRESQALYWCRVAALADVRLLAANAPIVSALQRRSA